MDDTESGSTTAVTAKLVKISLEDVQCRHRRERKDLQAKIQALKKNTPKTNKKKRKEVMEEVARMETELDLKQADEIKVAEELQSAKLVESQSNGENFEVLESDEKMKCEPAVRVTKAQKRRDKKAREARLREEEILAASEDTTYTPKTIEARKLQSKLKKRDLVLYNIPSDGDCLYNAIRHQLMRHDLGTPTVQQLRYETANYIYINKDMLLPYMTNSETGDLITDNEFEKYCNDVRSTPAWGGQIELKALSSVLKVPIEIIQADGSPTIQGDEFTGDPLVITYHRHMYSLGEHYNSTIPLSAATTDGDYPSDDNQTNPAERYLN
ncbi:deubiquitinase OTUD6B [Glossina fuscipes]|uniref:ubiquitinyl hydrolase 1 n=1 Tax=Glossina fuscipes TaxID=7396 RepID=A0A9C5Z9Q9_9MUSC|nr:deubiquitinase OTUD6B [Glossina fuscipes]